MRYVEGTGTETYGAIETHRLVIKDVEGRVNYFDNATIEIAYHLGEKFYKITHNKGVSYYNPANIIFMEF